MRRPASTARWGCGGDLRRRGAEHDQLGGGGLCREVAAGGDLGGPGKGESSSGLLLHHQAKTLDSQFRIFEEITCDRVRVSTTPSARGRHCLRAGQLPEAFAAERYIEIPRDMVAVPCAAVPPLAAPAVMPRRWQPAPTRCCSGLAGHAAGADGRCEGAATAWRRRWRNSRAGWRPVATRFMGRGLFAESDAALVGTYMGVAGLPEVTQLVENSGRVVPARRDPLRHQLAVSEKKIDLRKTIVACDGEVRLGYHVYPQIPLAALVDALLARTGEPAVQRAVVRTQ